MNLALLIALAVVLTLAAVTIGANVIAAEKHLSERIERLYPSEDPAFLRTLGVLFGPPIVGGNTVRTLRNGVQIFPEMLNAIAAAQHTITFETFIYWSGKVGTRFAEALAERARAGVRVHVLLDFLGSNRLDAALVSLMVDAGVEVERFHPLRWYHLTRMNNRTHRKLLVIDGRIAFTGGVGIADEWDGDAGEHDHWRDTHYRLEGPAAAQVQAAFLDNWLKARGELLHGDGYFPPLEPRGEHPAQMFISSPSGGSESMHLMYNYALSCASRSIRIASAYFVPDEMTIEALRAAAERGVHVQLLVPGPDTDSAIARRASQRCWGRLMEAGVEIHVYRRCRLHWKVLILDGWWTSVGSTNFDNRSFRLNDEANLNIYDAAFAREQEAQFEQDLADSERVTIAAWSRRSLKQRAIEWASDLVRSQL